MKRYAIRLLICLMFLVAAVALAWITMPATVAMGLLKLNNMSAGLTEKTVATEVGDIHYLEGGQGQTIVLVHGIYARKEHWVDVARSLVGDYHVVAIDLPGFGENARLPDAQYLLDQQQQNLLTVLRALDVEAVHIGANSMGAYAAALVAAAHPEMVASFAFIGSPLGVPTPVQSDMDVARAKGQTPLAVQSEADFRNRNDWLAPEIPYVPGPILDTWMKSEVATADHNKRIWDVVHHQSNVPTVLALAPALTMPSLVIWCQPDRIFHVSGAGLLDQALPNSALSTPENCGHVPMLDQPHEVAATYLAFLQGLKTPDAQDR